MKEVIHNHVYTTNEWDTASLRIYIPVVQDHMLSSPVFPDKEDVLAHKKFNPKDGRCIHHNDTGNMRSKLIYTIIIVISSTNL